jgi:hypothetical protein
MAIAEKKRPMEWEYYTNQSKREEIDNLLQQAASLFANCDSTPEAKVIARKREKEILRKVSKIDSFFAERCGCNELD